MKPDTFTKRFAKRLKECREDYAQMTQAELAAAAGISAQWVSHFECGRRLPSLKIYAALVRALETNAENMIGLGDD